MRHGDPNSDDRSNETSLLVDQKRTEPLITKAYNAFRQSNKRTHVEGLVLTGEYLDEQQQATFRETTLSGLRHA